MLTKHTHIASVLIALAFPGSALAATGASGSVSDSDPSPAAKVRPQAGISDATPVAIASVAGPVKSFHRAIEVGVRRIRVERRRRHRERFATLPGGVSIATLEAIAACESGGDPTIVSSDGSYRGKYQFSFETWASVGGSGDPAAAPEAEQDYRAALLYSQSGSSPWPVCGV